MTHDTGLYAAYSPTGRTTFCGPTAIAAATGMSLKQVEDAVLKFRKQAAARGRSTPRERGMHGARVKTMWAWEIAPVCRALGFTAQTVTITGRGRALIFGALAEIMQSGALRGPAIILATGHFVALSRWKFVDNRHRNPIDHALYIAQRHHVHKVWTIRKTK